MSATSIARSSLVERLGALVGAAHVGGDAHAPVVRPGDAEEVAAVLRLARAERVQVAVGGGAPSARALRLDLQRMASVLYLDETSLLVQAQAGITVRALLERLAPRGLSLGRLPPSTLERTLGAVLAAPRPSEATPRGRLLDACAAVEALLPDGTPVATRMAPRKATGPDLMHALLGARGATGVIAVGWLRVLRKPTHRLHAGLACPGREAALATANRLLASGALPAELLLADGAALAFSSDGERAHLRDGEVLLAALFDGSDEVVAAEEALLRELGGAARPVPPPLVEGWLNAPRIAWRERFVPSMELAKRWQVAPSPSLLGAFHAAGATLWSEAPPVDQPSPEGAVAARLRAALRRALDPDAVLAAE